MYCHSTLCCISGALYVVCIVCIVDRSLALMYQLQNTILPDMESMLALLDLCAQLDWYHTTLFPPVSLCLFVSLHQTVTASSSKCVIPAIFSYISLSSFCMENNYVRPEFVTASQLDIRESR